MTHLACGSLSLYESVARQLARLITLFDLHDRREEIARTYEFICGESLAIPLGRRPPPFSKISNDGTPFQFSLMLGKARPPLQFLSEVGIPGSSTHERVTLSRERISGLTRLLFRRQESAVDRILDQQAPSNNPRLLADPGGAFWVGASFSPSSAPVLKVYINGKWGSEDERWERVDSFVANFGVSGRWVEIRKILPAWTRPLGMALTIGVGGYLKGRVYFRTYDNSIERYEKLTEFTESQVSQLLHQFTETFSDENRPFPTGSVVCSFGFPTGRELDFKFEVCGHCVFTNDASAAQMCVRWLESIGIDPSPYLLVLEVVSDNRLCEKKTELHCFVGFGFGHGSASSSIYLKPRVMPSLC